MMHSPEHEQPLDSEHYYDYVFRLLRDGNSIEDWHDLHFGTFADDGSKEEYDAGCEAVEESIDLFLRAAGLTQQELDEVIASALPPKVVKLIKEDAFTPAQAIFEYLFMTVPIEHMEENAINSSKLVLRFPDGLLATILMEGEMWSQEIGDDESDLFFELRTDGRIVRGSV